MKRLNTEDYKTMWDMYKENRFLSFTTVAGYPGIIVSVPAEEYGEPSILLLERPKVLHAISSNTVHTIVHNSGWTEHMLQHATHVFYSFDSAHEMWTWLSEYWNRNIEGDNDKKEK